MKGSSNSLKRIYIGMISKDPGMISKDLGAHYLNVSRHIVFYNWQISSQTKLTVEQVTIPRAYMHVISLILSIVSKNLDLDTVSNDICIVSNDLDTVSKDLGIVLKDLDTVSKI